MPETICVIFYALCKSGSYKFMDYVLYSHFTEQPLYTALW